MSIVDDEEYRNRIYFSIGDVAQELDVPQSTLRFWMPNLLICPIICHERMTVAHAAIRVRIWNMCVCCTICSR